MTEIQIAAAQQAARAPDGLGEQDQRLEQYKLYVELTDRISERRQTANSFFLAMHSLLLPALSALWAFAPSDAAWRIQVVVAAAGMLLSYTWYRLVHSYRIANWIRYAVIHDMETRLPEQPYTREKDGKGLKVNSSAYTPFTSVEMKVPWIFFGLYLLLIVLQIAPVAARAFG